VFLSSRQTRQGGRRVWNSGSSGARAGGSGEVRQLPKSLVQGAAASFSPHNFHHVSHSPETTQASLNPSRRCAISIQESHNQPCHLLSHLSNTRISLTHLIFDVIPSSLTWCLDIIAVILSLVAQCFFSLITGPQSSGTRSTQLPSVSSPSSGAGKEHSPYSITIQRYFGPS
jgi:hypothetical protein